MRTPLPSSAARPRLRSRTQAAVLAVAAALLTLVGLPWVWSPARAADPATCPIGQDQFPVLGAYSAAEAMRQWSIKVCQSSSLDLGLDYTFMNDSDARARMLDGEGVFALSQVPFQDYDASHLTAKGVTASDFVSVPLLVTGIVCTERLPYLIDGAIKPKSVWLDPAAVAALHNGRVTTAMDLPTKIVAANATNPDAPPLFQLGTENRFFPMTSFTSLASGYTGTTRLLLQYVYSDPEGKAEWEKIDTSWLAGQPFTPGVHDSMPTGLPYNNPESGEQRILFRQQDLTQRGITNLGLFGCVNSSVLETTRAESVGADPRLPAGGTWGDYLRTSKLENLKGTFVAPTTDAIAKGAALMQDAGDGTFSTPTTAAGWTDPDAYPIPALTFAIVPKRFTNKDDWKKATDLLTWAITEGQKGLPAGYAPLTAAMAAKAKTQIAAITAPVDPTTTTTAPSSDNGTIGGSSDGFDSYDASSSGSGVEDFSSSSGSSYGDDGSYGSSGTGYADETATGTTGGDESAQPSNLTQQPTGLRSILAVLGGGNALPPTLFAFVAVILLATAPVLRGIDRRKTTRTPGAGR